MRLSDGSLSRRFSRFSPAALPSAAARLIEGRVANLTKDPPPLDSTADREQPKGSDQVTHHTGTILAGQLSTEWLGAEAATHICSHLISPPVRYRCRLQTNYLQEQTRLGQP
jgi:hypothetical protein